MALLVGESVGISSSLPETWQLVGQRGVILRGWFAEWHGVGRHDGSGLTKMKKRSQSMIKSFDCCAVCGLPGD